MISKKNFRSSEENIRISEEERERFLVPSSPDIKRTSFLNDNNEDVNVIVREEDDDVDEDLSSDIEIVKDQYEELDHIISSIGMGKFQKRLLVLCGFGWLSDAVCFPISLDFYH
jgi:hypothetical protein